MTTINIQRVNYITTLRKKNEGTSVIYERGGQEEIEIFIKERKHERKGKLPVQCSAVKTFKRYLSSINKGSTGEVLDLPAVDLDHLLGKFFL